MHCLLVVVVGGGDTKKIVERVGEERGEGGRGDEREDLSSLFLSAGTSSVGSSYVELNAINTEF